MFPQITSASSALSGFGLCFPLCLRVSPVTSLKFFVINTALFGPERIKTSRKGIRCQLCVLCFLCIFPKDDEAISVVYCRPSWVFLCITK